MSLFAPYKLNKKMTLANRFVMAPMTTYSGNKDLTVSSGELNYYQLRSKNIGMVITAATSINEQAQAFDCQITLKADSYIPSMRILAKTIQNEGAKAIVQLHHGGRMNAPHLYQDKNDIVSASAVKAERPQAITPRMLSETEIHQTIEDFVQATKRAIKAGFDGVELHGANTYLLQQFVSPHSNRRTDRFGGDINKRLTFIDMLTTRVKEVIETAERPFIWGYRFSPEELEEPGITLMDTLELIKLLKTKQPDFLHVSLGHYLQSSIKNTNDKKPLIDYFQTVLKYDIPMIGVGGIDSRTTSENALKSGYDLVAVGTALLADPDFIKHIEQSDSFRRVFHIETLPKPLYDRLKNRQDYYIKKGYEFA